MAGEGGLVSYYEGKKKIELKTPWSSMQQRPLNVPTGPLFGSHRISYEQRTKPLSSWCPVIFSLLVHTAIQVKTSRSKAHLK